MSSRRRGLNVTGCLTAGAVSLLVHGACTDSLVPSGTDAGQPERVCEAGATEPCWCDNGAVGVKLCADDGTRWSACSSCEEQLADTGGGAEPIDVDAASDAGTDQDVGSSDAERDVGDQGHEDVGPVDAGLDAGADSGNDVDADGDTGFDSGTDAGCKPVCTTKACGDDDGCGGKCSTYCTTPPTNRCETSTIVVEYEPDGTCDPNSGCIYTSHPGFCPNGCENGQCKGCTPVCAGKTCGPDSCGGSCGACGQHQLCVGSSCCTPACTPENCSDGCGHKSACPCDLSPPPYCVVKE